MSHRLFIAIPIPEEIKKEIAEKIQPCQHFLFRFVKKENWHITVLFLGYIKDFEIPAICEELEKIAKECEPFLINFDKIVYGPDFKNPRMIWLTAARNKEFENLKNDIQNCLRSKISFKEEKRPSRIHLTLARRVRVNPRVNPRQSANASEASMPENVDLQFKAETVDLMESRLKRGGAEYILLKKSKFKNQNGK